MYLKLQYPTHHSGRKTQGRFLSSHVSRNARILSIQARHAEFTLTSVLFLSVTIRPSYISKTVAYTCRCEEGAKETNSKNEWTVPKTTLVSEPLRGKFLIR